MTGIRSKSVMYSPVKKVPSAAAKAKRDAAIVDLNDSFKKIINYNSMRIARGESAGIVQFSLNTEQKDDLAKAFTKMITKMPLDFFSPNVVQRLDDHMRLHGKDNYKLGNRTVGEAVLLIPGFAALLIEDLRKSNPNTMNAVLLVASYLFGSDIPLIGSLAPTFELDLLDGAIRAETQLGWSSGFKDATLSTSGNLGDVTYYGSVTADRSGQVTQIEAGSNYEFDNGDTFTLSHEKKSERDQGVSRASHGASYLNDGLYVETFVEHKKGSSVEYGLSVNTDVGDNGDLFVSGQTDGQVFTEGKVTYNDTFLNADNFDLEANYDRDAKNTLKIKAEYTMDVGPGSVTASAEYVKDGVDIGGLEYHQDLENEGFFSVGASRNSEGLETFKAGYGQFIGDNTKIKAHVEHTSGGKTKGQVTYETRLDDGTSVSAYGTINEDGEYFAGVGVTKNFDWDEIL